MIEEDVGGYDDCMDDGQKGSMGDMEEDQCAMTTEEEDIEAQFSEEECSERQFKDVVLERQVLGLPELSHHLRVIVLLIK